MNKNRYIDGNRNASECNSRQIAQMIQDPLDTQYVNSGNVRLLACEVDPRFRKTTAMTRDKRAKNTPIDPETCERLMEIATKPIKHGNEIYTSYGYSAAEYAAFGMMLKDNLTLNLPSPHPVDILQTIFG